MRHRSRLALLTNVALIAGLFAVPASAQEGFADDLESCIDALAAALEGEDDDAIVEIDGEFFTVAEALEKLYGIEDPDGLPDVELSALFAEICTFYASVVLGIAVDVSAPIGACITDEIPALVFSTTVDTGTVDVFFVDLSGTTDDNAPVVEDDPDYPGGSFDGQDVDGEAVSGVIRAQETVDLAADGSDGTFEILWPGMVLNDDGDPVKWPNWDPVPNLENPRTWSQNADDGFAWARATEASQDLGVFFRFNPETKVFYVGYPPPDTDCADPDRPEEPEVAGVTLTRPAEVLGTRLPVTGVDAAILGLFGAVLLGLGVLAVRRTRPKGSGPR